LNLRRLDLASSFPRIPEKLVVAPIAPMRESLVYVVVEFPGDPTPFLFLRVDQSAAYRREGFFG
jgi:hypothetical protein